MPTIFDAQRDENNQKLESKPFKISKDLPVDYKTAKSQHLYLHSFCIRPQTRFETQRDDEELILLIRAHPITQIPWILAVIVLSFVPILLSLFFGTYFSASQIIFANAIWYSFLFSYSFVNIINYIFNVGVVTNFRIVDFDFHNVLYKEVNETVLTKIEDITAKTGGFIRTIFHYGDIFIQTAGAEANIEFMGAPEPTEIAAIVNELIRRSQK